MLKSSTLAIAIAMIFATVTNAAILEFSESGEDLTIVAKEADDSAEYWSMVVKLPAAAAPGRIMGFYDLTGASDPGYNYVHRYHFGPGMLDPIDNGNMRDGGKYTAKFAPYSDGDSSLTYTLSRVETDGGGGTKTTTAVFVINAPDANGTAINTTTTLAFDSLWTPANGQGRIRAQMLLHNSVDSDNGEWTEETYNGFADGTNNSYVKVTSTGADTGSAAGRSFMMTLGWDQGDGAYDDAYVSYGSLGSTFVKPGINQGITGAWAGKPTAGESYVSTADVEINIAVPEPASLGLLALGGLMLARRR